jgi:hypothetical protein
LRDEKLFFSPKTDELVDANKLFCGRQFISQHPRAGFAIKARDFGHCRLIVMKSVNVPFAVSVDFSSS